MCLTRNCDAVRIGADKAQREWLMRPKPPHARRRFGERQQQLMQTAARTATDGTRTAERALSLAQETREIAVATLEELGKQSGASCKSDCQTLARCVGDALRLP